MIESPQWSLVAVEEITPVPKPVLSAFVLPLLGFTLVVLLEYSAGYLGEKKILN